MQRALERSGSTHDLDTVYKMLCRGEAQFWATPTCFVITEIVDYPLKRAVRLSLVGGDELQDLLDTFHDRILDWGWGMKCSEAEFLGRPGWHRVLPEGWKRRSETCIWTY